MPPNGSPTAPRAPRCPRRAGRAAPAPPGRAGGRTPGATPGTGLHPGDEARRAATVAQDQARAACDQATTRRDEAVRVLDSAEHPRLRRPRAQRVETARQHLAAADAALGQAVDQLRLASERLAALQPDAVAAARVPLEQRLEHVNEAIAAHVEEAIASPAPYLYTALGARSDNPTQRPRWEKAARDLETWRHAELSLGPADGPLDDEGLAAAWPGAGQRNGRPPASDGNRRPPRRVCPGALLHRAHRRSRHRARYRLRLKHSRDAESGMVVVPRPLGLRSVLTPSGDTARAVGQPPCG